MILAWFRYQLAGIWPLIWHFGIGGVIVLACVVLYVFTPAFLSKLFPNIQKVLIWIASVTIAAMVFTAIGVSLGEKRIQAQWDAALASETTAGEQARANAVDTVRHEPPDSVRNDPRNRDNWGKKSSSAKGGTVRGKSTNGLLGSK